MHVHMWFTMDKLLEKLENAPWKCLNVTEENMHKH